MPDLTTAYKFTLKIDDKKIDNFRINEITYKSKLSESFLMTLMLTYTGNLKKEHPSEAKDFINKSFELEIKMQDKYIKKFCGIISNLKINRHLYRDLNESYSITVIPDLPIKRIVHNNVYINKTTKDIIADLLQNYRKINFTPNLKAPKPRDFCMQYNEPDIGFINRLISEEGWFSYLDEDNFVVCDSVKGYKDPQIDKIFDKSLGYADKQYYPYFYCNAINSSSQIKTVNAYHHDHTKANEVQDINGNNSDSSKCFANDTYTMDIWPHCQSALNNNNLDMEIEREQSVNGEYYEFNFYNKTGAFFLTPGFLFKYKLKAEEKEEDFAVIETSFTYSVTKKAARFHEQLHGRLTAIKKEKLYYSPLIPSPFIPPQRAAVVAPGHDKSPQRKADSDDKHSVCLEFYFQNDISKSKQDGDILARVMQPWAGKNKGWFGCPETGTEVLVYFPYGPNHLPIVLGCFYDSVNTCPSEDDLIYGLVTADPENSGFTQSFKIDNRKKTFSLGYYEQ